MKISNILTLILVSLLTISCTKKQIKQNILIEETGESVDALTLLKEKSEQNNPYVINAKNELSRFVGEKNFNNYITQHNILKCQTDENQSACVLDFYLTEITRFKLEREAKKHFADMQEMEKELTKLESSDENIKEYCGLSADFINLLYHKPTAKSLAYYQERFKLDSNELSTLMEKFEKDSYTHFLINENPTITKEMKTDNVNRCLLAPKNSIINYSAIFK